MEPDDIRTAPSPAPTSERHPWLPLVILAATGVVFTSAETMPAGLLPVIAAGIDTTEGTVGQFVSAYALGTVIATSPAIALTRAFRRKPLLVVGMLAAHDRRISPERYAGLSLSIVSTGAPLGFAFGTPLGALIGTVFDWRWSFGGIGIILAVIAAWMIGHNTLDRIPRTLLHGSTVLFVTAGALFIVGHTSAPVTVVASVLWGVSFGGAAAQLQSALTTAGRDDSDVANSFLPVAFNVAIFIAGLFGAGLLVVVSPLVLALVMVVFGLIALGLTLIGHRSAF